MDLTTLTTHAQRLGARLSENLAERSKDLGLPLSLDALSNPSTAIGIAAGPAKGMWDDARLLTVEGERETRRLLESRSEREREEGLRRVIALMCKGRPVSSYFPLVTNCLHSSTFTTTSAAPTAALTTRQLVSSFIVRHATVSPDLALLSVNAWQKDLTDPNPAIRALALRTLAGMQLDTVAPLIIMSVARAVRDGNWWVRKAAAEALVSVYRLDPQAHGAALITGPLAVLLADRSPLVIGAALEAWSAVCPTRYDLLHQNYRRYCRMLVDADQWGQIVVMRILTRYARLHFKDPAASSADKLDPDLELLLRSTQVLFQSHNQATLLAAVHLFCFLAPAPRLQAIAEPLIAMIRAPASEELLYIVLSDILRIASRRRDLFIHYLPNFFIFASDPAAIKSAKLRIMLVLTDASIASEVMAELRHYTRDHDQAFAGQAVAAIASVAVIAPETSIEATKLLIKHSRSSSASVVSQAVLALRRLLGHPSIAASRTSILARLSRLLIHGHVLAPLARATIYALVGQYASDQDDSGSLVQTVAPDLLRVAAKGFGNEAGVAKLQILTLATKLLVLSYLASLSPHLRFYNSTFRYIITLARYDEDYIVRDRARLLVGLIDAAAIAAPQDSKVTLTADAFARGEDLLPASKGPDDEKQKKPKLSAQVVRQILCDRKSAVPTDDRESFASEGQLGSFAGLFGHGEAEDDPMPPWAASAPDASIRDVETTASSSGLQTPRGMPILRGFGSETFASSAPSSAGFGRSATGASSGRNSPVVLVPTHRGGGGEASAAASKGGYKDLSDFLGDSEEESEEEEGEGEQSEDESGSEEEEEGEEEDPTPAR